MNIILQDKSDSGHLREGERGLVLDWNPELQMLDIKFFLTQEPCKETLWVAGAARGFEITKARWELQESCDGAMDLSFSCDCGMHSHVDVDDDMDLRTRRVLASSARVFDKPAHPPPFVVASQGQIFVRATLLSHHRMNLRSSRKLDKPLDINLLLL